MGRWFVGAPTPGRPPARWLAHVVIVGLLFAHLAEIAFDREHWPFSAYPMYSSVARERKVIAYRLVGIERQSGQEFRLLADQHIHPFDQSRLPSALSDLWHKPESKHLVNRAMEDVWDRYEKRRRSGLHEGPELSRLRLYWTSYDLDDQARNSDTPTERELLAEIEAPSTDGAGRIMPTAVIE